VVLWAAALTIDRLGTISCGPPWARTSSTYNHVFQESPLQLLFESTAKPGDMVFRCGATTGIASAIPLMSTFLAAAAILVLECFASKADPG
jgi:hypothetical protein